MHSFTGTTGYASATTVALDIVANSDAGTVTDMDFGGGGSRRYDEECRTAGRRLAHLHRTGAGRRRQPGAVSSPRFYVDTVAPITTWSLTLPHSTGVLEPGWFSTDVVLHLGVLDASGVGTVYSQIGARAWLRGGPLRFDARADHSLDGWYTVHLYSKDAAGNIEVTPQTVEFGIDTTAPTTAATAPVVTRPGETATVHFVVRDGAASRVNAGSRRGAGPPRQVRPQARPGDRRPRRACGAPLRVQATAGPLPLPGPAVDGAGNHSVRQTAARLVVR